MDGSGSNRSTDEDLPSTSRYQSEDPHRNLCHILIVEDNAADIFLFRAAIKAADIHADLHVLKDGEQATRFFDETDGDDLTPSPALVILDINLPRKQGGEVLQHIRRSRRSSNALVIAVSTSASTQDREHMMSLGANSYFHKPSNYADFMKLGDTIKSLLDAPTAR
jgi:two-component system, chemotaxis family, response regulator Rcp1